MAYDGITPLKAAVADLIKCSPKSNNKLAKVIGQAKIDLSITSKARKLPTEINLQIYTHLVELYSQLDNDEPVEIISQDNAPTIPEPRNTQQAPVEIFSQDSKKKSVPQKAEKPHNLAVNIISQTTSNNPVELYSHTPNFDNLRVAFYAVRNNKRERQVISLDGYFINALASIKVSKQDVPQWVQAQVDEWTAFDSQLPITRQVKYLIMREVVKSLSGSDDLFHAPIND